MQKDCPVHIETVANGFIVRPHETWYRNYGRGGDDGMSDVARKEIMVFQTWEELSRFLFAHFTHRANEIHTD